MNRFTDKVAIVTGGASGIGAAVVREFASEGAAVAIFDINAQGGQAYAAELQAAGYQVSFLCVDVSDADVVAQAVTAVVALYGKVNYLVNSAVSFTSKGLDATTPEWERSLGVNVRGNSNMVQSCYPHMKAAGGGAIVNIASISAHIAQPNRWTYNATKGAIVTMSKCQALDLAPDNIRVNVVSPGWIWTPEVDKAANNDRAKWEPIWDATICCAAWGSRRKSPTPYSSCAATKPALSQPPNCRSMGVTSVWAAKGWVKLLLSPAHNNSVVAKASTRMTDNSLPNDRRLLRKLTRALSLILLLPIIILLAVVVTTPLTLSGLLYFTGVVAIIIGIWSLAWAYTRFRRVLWLGLGLIVIVAAVRVFLLRNSPKIKLLTLPDQNGLCVVNCLVDEQDAALVSTRLLPLIGWISPTEQTGLMDAMYAGYQAMAQAQPLVASPFPRTYLNLQRSGAFDAVTIEPDDNQPPQMGVIFLHGFTGNFTMPCWLVAQAVRTSHALTICPSVGWKGDWWTSNGEATLRATIDYLHQRGLSRIVLAGLSNGAVGASELAYKLTADIAGLILISGASLDAKDSGLPVLVLAGTDDERMPATMMHAYANQLGDKATFIELPADHFMLAKKAAEIQHDIDSWLRQH